MDQDQFDALFRQHTSTFGRMSSMRASLKIMRDLASRPGDPLLDSEDDEGYPSDSEYVAPPMPPLPGDVDPTEYPNKKPKTEKLDPKLVGMSVGYKNLYSGKEDRRGRFQWQDTIPEDLGKPAENAETAKWALIVRYVKTYSDPLRTLGLHSIVVQSPLLKKVLEEVLLDYPGVTVGLQRLEFSGKFQALIHRFSELNTKIDCLKEEVDKEKTSQDGIDEESPRKNGTVTTAQEDDAGENSDLAVHSKAVESLDGAKEDETKEDETKEDETKEDETKEDETKEDETKEDETKEDETKMTPGEKSTQPAQSSAEHIDVESKMDMINGTVTDSKNGEAKDGLEMGDAAPEEAISESELTLKHAELLRNLLMTEFRDMIESSQDMKGQGVMTYEHLWTLFEPGHLIYCRLEGQERVCKLHSGKEAVDHENRPIFRIALSYIDFDGTKFGWRKTKVDIYPFEGTRAITSLPAYPLIFHREKEALKVRLIERGSKIETFCGTHYRAYDGVGWKLDQWGQKEKHSVSGRIIIDTVGWNRYQPNSAVFVSPLDSESSSRESNMRIRTMALPSEALYDDGCGDYGGMPIDGHFTDEEEQKKSPLLSDDQKLLCGHLLRGYALKEKMWLNLFVSSVQDITFNSSAFESLVLPENQKELILGFTCTQQSYRHSYDDVIQGKGRGIILLLCGPPGVGKTLTAESVAEEMKVPLFVMSAGDLGMDSKTIEARLLSILGMCTRWNAILLLDEADIFLEERSLHEVERNKLVSIFLRVLEYHEGIMFLTTNRVQTFDPAFQSRIHISIDYPELSPESRRTIWENFLRAHDTTQANARKSPPRNPISSIKSASEATEIVDEEATKAQHEALTQPHAITKQQVKELSRLRLNGRQIKNVLKTAQLLANRKAEPLMHAHIATVLDVTQHLHKVQNASDHVRGSIFN